MILYCDIDRSNIENTFIKNVSPPCEKLAVVRSLVARCQDPLIAYKHSHRSATNGDDIYTYNKQIYKIMKIARIAGTLDTLCSAWKSAYGQGTALPPLRDTGQSTLHLLATPLPTLSPTVEPRFYTVVLTISTVDPRLK